MTEQDIVVEGFVNQMKRRGWTVSERDRADGKFVVEIERMIDGVREFHEFREPLRRKAFYEACSWTKHHS